MSLYMNGKFYRFHCTFNFNPTDKIPYVSVEVSRQSGANPAVIVGIMNTGANTSILTSRTASAIGIKNIKTGKRIKCLTMSGKSIKCYEHFVTIRIKDNQGNMFEFILFPAFAKTKKIKKDQFGMDWTANLCLAFDRQSVHLLRD